MVVRPHPSWRSCLRKVHGYAKEIFIAGLASVSGLQSTVLRLARPSGQFLVMNSPDHCVNDQDHRPVALGFQTAIIPCRISVALALLLASLPVSAGVLSGDFIPLAPGTHINLTAFGPLDWEHWGLNSATNINRKAGVTPRIGALTAVGANPIQRLTTNQVGFTWSDGTPTLSAAKSPTGVFIRGLNNGFELTTSADSERRRLFIFAGVEAATVLLEALLSDGSAPGYYDESLASAGPLSNGVYVIDFAAGPNNKTLTVRFTAQTLYETNGRVVVQAAALISNLPPTVQLSSPVNNASFFNLADITLAADASDNDGTILLVEFYSGAQKLGEVIDPPYTLQWNAVPSGTYALTARATDHDGATTVSAPVGIEVQPNFAPTVAMSNPASFASYAAPANILLEATASDMDGTVAKVEFYRGNQKVGEVMNSPYLFTWTNATAGEYLVTARATDNQGAMSVSKPVSVFLTAHGGYLSVTSAIISGDVFLDAEGPADWVHWGLYTENSFNRKRGVVPLLNNATVSGDAANPFADNANTYTWADGTPTPAMTNTPTGIYVVGSHNEFHLEAPAGLATNTLKVFVGAYGARGQLLAYLDDFSTPVVADFSVNNPFNGPSTVYTLRYAATAPDKILHVRFLVDTDFSGDGNVTLQAAALDTGNSPPSAVVTDPPNGSSLLWPGNVTISAAAADVDGSVTNVEFYLDGLKLGQKTTSPYTMVWSNATLGSHRLAARAIDNRGLAFTSRVAQVFVTIGGGTLITSSAFPPAQLDLSTEGLTDWTHWGLTKANSFNHLSGANTRIANVTTLGNANAKQYADNFTGYFWTHGTPTPTAENSHTGIFVYGLANGFQITAPADRARRRLNVYVGLYGARGRFEAFLSDHSAPSFTDSSLHSVYGNQYRVYTIDYASATPGQKITVRHIGEELFDTDFGNVTLQAATLVDLGPQLLDGNWDGTAFRFRVPTRSSWTYTVEYSDLLPATSWQTLQSFPGTGTDVWVTNSFPLSAQRFYRIVGD